MKSDVLIIGAGAAGLMAARDLADAGKKVLIIEARDRIGGRIFSLSQKDFGYNAEGGAEFVHGEAPITMELITKAGLTYVPSEGTLWNIRSGKPTKSEHGPTGDPRFLEYKIAIVKKLKELHEDIPIAEFLEINFSASEFAAVREWITMMVEDYDAGDPKRMSSFALRDEWLGGEEWKQGKIKEGYGPLVDYLGEQCKTLGVEIILNEEIISVEALDKTVEIKSLRGNTYEGNQVIVTLPVPIIQDIKFIPDIGGVLTNISSIGFGGVIKFLFRFKSRWWLEIFEEDLSSGTFLLVNPPVTAWWTQYPETYPVLTGWIPGPHADKYKNATDQEIIELGLHSLIETFRVERSFLEEQLIFSKVINWPADTLSQGAYSYPTPKFLEARAALVEPIKGKIFLAGEALYSGDETATVEGALGSGKEVAEKIIMLK